MTKELAIPPGTDIALADLIKKCLNRDVNSRYDITAVLEHPFLAAKLERRPIAMALSGKLGMFSTQKVKRTSSQSSQRSGTSIGSIATSILLSNLEGKSVDKRNDKETSTYQSLLKDLSKHSMTSDEKPRLITTTGMQPCSYSTKNGKISILKDGSVEVDLSAKKQKIVKISADGETVI
jgi:serine/threonine protein kinase